MSITWPSTLPQTPLIEGFEQQAPATVLRTEMSAGAAKTRRRFTAAPLPTQCRFVMTKTQMNSIFKPWLRDQAMDGALPFDYKDPTTGVAKSCRIIGQPKYSPAPDPQVWWVDLALEVLP